jgi:branched-chain amino acid transport system ATP-binding protein
MASDRNVLLGRNGHIYRRVMTPADQALVLQKVQVVLQGAADEVAGSATLANYLGV